MDKLFWTTGELEEFKYLLHKHGHIRVNKFLASALELLSDVRSYADCEWEKTIQKTKSENLLHTGGTMEEFQFGLKGKENTPLYNLASHPLVLQTIINLTNWESISLLHAYLFYKAPSGGFTPWHQDNSYLPVDQKAITIWIPLVDLEEPNGMVFANGSQDLNICWNEIKQKGLHNYFNQQNCRFELVSSLSVGDVDIHYLVVGHIDVHCAGDSGGA